MNAAETRKLMQSVLRGLTAQQIEQLIQAMVAQKVPAGQALINEGERVSGLMVLLQGRVEIFKHGPDGLHQPLANLDAPTLVGEMSVITDRPADSLGLMFAHTHFTDNPQIFQSQQRDGQPGPAGGSEMSVESYYLWQWTSWSYLQPGIMWIITPGGGDPAPLDDALLIYGLVGFEF